MNKRAGSAWTLGLVSTALLAGAPGGCSSDEAEAPVTVDQARSEKVRESALNVPPADIKALADGNAAFAVALYKEVEGKNPNLVFSPASISTALAMTWAGARSETETQMATALRFTLPQARLHPAMNHLTAELAARGEGKQGADGKAFRLRIVNATWVQKGFTVVPAYLDVMAQSYGAGVNLLDFVGATEPSRLTINGWVSQQTEQRIKDLIPMGAIDAATVLVLTNAVYFNAAWRTPFAKDTADGPFTRADGTSVRVPIMNLTSSFRAGVLPGLATAVALPYQDERLSMLVVLPDEGKLGALETQIAGGGLAAIEAALQQQSVILTMPRFRFETPLDLEQELSTLGMPIAFSRSADFSGISAEAPLQIGAVLHKAFIAVGETGTEAAAATAVVIRTTSVPQGLHIQVNRPFLFFVRDEATGAILFMGRVSDPSATSR
jgi:serpin B